MKIEETVIMITGASSGIGEATAGARVILLARRKERLDALADGSGKALAVACDVTQPDQIENAVRQGLARFGRIDVLINNPGQGLYAAVEEIEAAEFRALLELNLVAPLMMMQAVIPPMRRQGAGCIINVSSGATLATYPGSAAYTSAKAALNMLSGVARLELAEAGITVSVVHPFMTASEFY
ncbi:SDR family oxidoreductase [Pantoea vagans]|uniref:SDR family oxidoreductase n=1 Tax=Pantoea vagans TaxID=470934 RepID=UPI000AAE54CF|nr:SDR family oxidoreductase [Pantoea vagans]